MRSATYCYAEKLSEGSKRVFASRVEWWVSPGGVSRRHGRSDIVVNSTKPYSLCSVSEQQKVDGKVVAARPDGSFSFWECCDSSSL